VISSRVRKRDQTKAFLALLISKTPKILKLLPPLLLGRRGILLLLLKLTLPLAILKAFLSHTYVIMGDWYRGRYMRLTYTNLERYYYRHYEGDYIVRSFSRTIVQILVLLLSAEIITIVIGDNGIGLGVTRKIQGYSRRAMGTAYCVAWLGIVIGISTAYNSAVSFNRRGLLSVSPAETPRAGGFLRVMADLPQGFYFLRLLRGLDVSGGRIWNARNDKYLENASTYRFPRSYYQYNRQTYRNHRSNHMFPHLHIPHPWVFPAVWVPLRGMQFLGIGRLLLSTAAHMEGGRVGGHIVTRTTGIGNLAAEAVSYFLLQLAIGDEWNRVLFMEHKIGLGLFVSLVHLFSISRCYICYVRFARETEDVRLWHANAFILSSVVWCAGGVCMNWNQWMKMTREIRKRKRERKEREKLVTGS